jgi:hypothetical protein
VVVLLLRQLLLCQQQLYIPHHAVDQLHICLDLREQCTCGRRQLLHSMQHTHRYKTLCGLLLLLLLQLCGEACWVNKCCLQNLLELPVGAVLWGLLSCLLSNMGLPTLLHLLLRLLLHLQLPLLQLQMRFLLLPVLLLLPLRLKLLLLLLLFLSRIVFQ